MSGDSMYKISVPREMGLELLKFLNGVSFNTLIAATVNASTGGSNLGDILLKIMSGETVEQTLKVFAATTPYINARMGEKISNAIAQKYVIDNEILLHRLQEAKANGLDITDEQILQLINKQGREAQKIINRSTGNTVTAEELAEKVDGLSLETAKALLGEHALGMKVWFKVRDSNIIGIVIAGTTTMLLPQAAIPLNPFWAQLTRGAIGYTTATIVEKFPRIKNSAASWWSSRPRKVDLIIEDFEKVNEKQPLISESRRLRYGEDDDAVSLHSGPPSGNVSEDEAPKAEENSPSSNTP